MHPLISAKEFKKLRENNSIIVIDARPNSQAYAKEHIIGAYHVDLNSELSEIGADAAHGGRHPLPSVKNFSQLLSGLNINRDSHIIIYDESNASMAAARLWWMLKAAGLEQVQVLNGGLKAAKVCDVPTGHIVAKSHQTSNFSFSTWKLPLVTIDEVEEASQLKNKTIIDVRSSERYLGHSEPIDKVAGHIPHAINLPFTENLNTDGTFLSPTLLKEKYQHIYRQNKAKDIIVHCGSGVTACHTLLALASAGFEIPNLYVGSWSEWSRQDKPIATEEK